MSSLPVYTATITTAAAATVRTIPFVSATLAAFSQKASDIWSLGCILYQMVYGQTPFAELHMIAKLQAIVNPNHRIEFGPTEDPAAVDAIRQCLQRNPDDRPPIVGKGGLLNEHIFLHP